MSWKVWNIKVDVKVYTIFRMRFSVMDTFYKNSREVCGAVLIRNANEFARIYTDTDKVRKWERPYGKGSARNTLGDGLDRLYIVPKTAVGAKHLHDLMTYTDDEMIHAVTAPLITLRLLFPLYTYPDTFPVSCGDRPFCVGVFMDVKRMEKMEMLKERGAVKEFGIFCYEWQIPYYSAVFPDTEILDIKAVERSAGNDLSRI